MTDITATIVERLNDGSHNHSTLDQSDLQECLQEAEKNGLLYPFMMELKESEQPPSKFRHQFQAEKGDIKQLRNTIRTINKVAASSGIEFALIKDANTINHIPRDVDILIHPSDKEKFLENAAGLGLKCDQSGDIETSLTGETIFPIDVYTRIVYFGVEFLEPSYVLDSIVDKETFDAKYPGLTREAALLLTMVHGVFGHRRFTLLDYLHIQNLLNAGVNIDECTKIAAQHGWRKTFEEFVGLIKSMNQSIHEKDDQIRFPYVLPYSQMLRYVKSVDTLTLSPRRQAIISFSLLLDGLKIRLENSRLHEPIKNCEPLRKFLLKIAYHSRKGRGDRYS